MQQTLGAGLQFTCLLHQSAERRVVLTVFCFHVFFAGWIESTSVLLRWFLEQKQAVFLGQTMWNLLCQYLALSLAKPERTTAYVVLGASIITIGQEYQQALLLPAGARRLSKDVADLLATIARCHGTVCRILFDSSRAVPCDEGPAMQQLLLSPALAEVLLLQFAGGCQHVHQQHQKGQQQFQAQMATPVGSNSSSRVNINTTTTSSSKVGISNSSSSRPGPLDSKSFAELVVPPDHDLVAAALGKEAVALYAGEAKPAPTDPDNAEVLSPLSFLQSSICPLVEVCAATLKVAAASGEPLDNRMPVSTTVCLQLLLEACVLCGELALRNSSLHYTVRYVLRMLGPLLSCVSRAERERKKNELTHSKGSLSPGRAEHFAECN